MTTSLHVFAATLAVAGCLALGYVMTQIAQMCAAYGDAVSVVSQMAGVGFGG